MANLEYAKTYIPEAEERQRCFSLDTVQNHGSNLFLV